MKPIAQIWRRLTQSLTLSQRLMLLTAGLLIILGFAQALFVSGLTDIYVPKTIEEVMLSATQIAPTEPIPDSLDQTTLSSPDVTETLPVQAIQESVLRDIRSISLILAGVFALIGVIGAYWIAQQALQPVKQLSRMVKEIKADTLDQRLALDGPSDEVKELADAFDNTLERLEEAFEQQGRFVADAAHELRTPLATLRTNLEVIQEDPNATLTDYQEMSVTLMRTLERMEQLTEDLLLLARGEKELHNEPINLEVLLTEVAQALKPLAQSDQITLELKIAGEVIILADNQILTRAVSNLIENGIHYNHPGGSVTTSAQVQGNGVVIQIEDTGIGITTEELPHIFERFYRVERSRTRHQGGSGLGLAIAAHSIQLLGGRIQVESTPAKGSIFFVWLPLAPEINSDL
jgi:signal transduction histidine kinase